LEKLPTPSIQKDSAGWDAAEEDLELEIEETKDL
jgi:hypothetical protein